MAWPCKQVSTDISEGKSWRGFKLSDVAEMAKAFLGPSPRHHLQSSLWTTCAEGSIYSEAWTGKPRWEGQENIPARSTCRAQV